MTKMKVNGCNTRPTLRASEKSKHAKHWRRKEQDTMERQWDKGAREKTAETARESENNNAARTEGKGKRERSKTCEPHAINDHMW